MIASLKEGQRVMFRKDFNQRWQTALVTEVHGNGTYDMRVYPDDRRRRPFVAENVGHVAYVESSQPSWMSRGEWASAA